MRAARRASSSVRTAAKRGCGTPVSAKQSPHRDLVRHQPRRLGADPGQAERLGHLRHDRDGPVGGDRQHAVDAVAAADVDHRRHVAEVHDLEGVGLGKPERLRVAVDGDRLETELARARDRSALVPAGADEEDGLAHGLDPDGEEVAKLVPAVDLAAVRAAEARVDWPAAGTSRGRGPVCGPP